MLAEAMESKYPILDDIEVPEREIENWQITVDLLSQLVNIPAARIMRAHNREIEVLVSSHSSGNVYDQGERALLDSGLYCEKVMDTQRELLVPNALKDPLWDKNPEIAVGMISYCGLPLTWPGGKVFGTICMLDVQEHVYSQLHRDLLERFRDGIQLSLENIHDLFVQRKRLEQESSGAWSYARSLIEASLDPLVTISADGRITDVNKATEEVTGLPRNSLIGSDFSDYFTESEKARAGYERVFSKRVVRDYPLTIRHTSGRTTDVLYNATVYRDETGEVQGVFAAARDVTERKQAESVLRESEARHRTILRTAMDGFWLVDMQGCLLEVNEAFVTMSGYSEAELLGMHVGDLEVADSAEEAAARIPRIKAEGAVRFESGIRRKDGTVFNVEVSVRYQPVDGGRMSGFLRDITERKKAADQVAKSLSSMISVVGRVIEARDPYTAGHERRVAELSARIAEVLGMSAERIEELRIAALVHDVGKVSVPAEILSKPGRLGDAEFEIIKGHSQAGHDILMAADMGGEITEMVYQHHERCDGSGYPRGLDADAILEGTKVLAVADVVEAMVSHRPYRPGLGLDAALAEIERGAGLKYDTAAVAACLICFREREFAFSEV